VTVPAGLIGMQQTDAEAAITGVGLVVGEVTQQVVQDESQVGTVLDTTPRSGAEVEEGSEVGLTVGQEPDTITVPSVIGLSEEDARDALTGAGFTGNINRDEVDSLEPEGTVVGVDPEQRTAVAPDTTITLSVSDGDLPIPPVTGDEAAARQQLVDVGFGNVTRQEVEDPSPAGTVLGTTPAAGTQATAATEIVLRVSSGPATPQTVALPPVAGQSENSALATLRNAGFTNVTVTRQTNDDVQETQAVATTPAAGTQVAPGTPIVLQVVDPSPDDN
jgi:beta-lactam-binding protein with PASTA domain